MIFTFIFNRPYCSENDSCFLFHILRTGANKMNKFLSKLKPSVEKGNDFDTVLNIILSLNLKLLSFPQHEDFDAQSYLFF